MVESDGVFIDSYFELRKQMTQLACANSDFVLFSEVRKETTQIIYIEKADLRFFQVFIEDKLQMEIYETNGLNISENYYRINGRSNGIAETLTSEFALFDSIR